MLNVEVAAQHYRSMYSSSSSSSSSAAAAAAANETGSAVLWLLHIDADELFFSASFARSEVRAFI